MKSSTLLWCEHAAIQPTKRSKAKAKPVPIASEVKTFDYVHGLLTAKFDRIRTRRTHG